MAYTCSERSKSGLERQFPAFLGKGLGRVRVVVWLDVELSLGLFGHEVGADEGVQIAIHDAIHVADFKFCPVVLDEAIRLHDVRADLTAEGNVQFALVELVGVRLAFLNFFIVQARAEHLHGHLSILALTALRLARHDDVCREVSDADGGLHLVDVLPAFASGTESVHAQIFGADVDLDAVVNFRNHEDRRKRSVAPRGLIERRNSDETVDAGLSGQQAIGIFAGKLNRCRLEAGFFSRRFIENLGGHSFALCPAQVHAKKDGSPILRFGSTSAGLDGHDGVEVIGFSGEKRLGFEFGDVGIRGIKLAVQLFEQIVLLLDVGFFLSEMNIGFDVAGERREFIVRGNLFFGALALAENALCSFLIVPERGIGDARFEGFQSLAVLRGVKDSSVRD